MLVRSLSICYCLLSYDITHVFLFTFFLSSECVLVRVVKWGIAYVYEDTSLILSFPRIVNVSIGILCSFCERET